MDFIYRMPAALLLFLILTTSIALVCAGQTLVHRHFKGSDFVTHNEVGGIIMAVSGSIYAVILGFLTVVAWEHFQEARELVVMEADADIDAWHVAVGLPGAVRARVRQDVMNYAQIMKAREWPLMKHGRFDADAAMITMDATDSVGSAVPQNSGEANAQNATMQQLTVMHDARQRRIAMNDSGVSWFEWLVLLIGAFCIVSFCWLFGLKNRRTHLLMTSTVVTVIASILVLLFELQYPFRSNVGIGPQSWENAITHLHQMQAGSMPGMKM
jgi:hypothetical protein